IGQAECSMSGSADRIYETVLVLRCRAGDVSAFEELVERYSPRLRYYLRKLLGDVHGAEDALQDVWLDAFRGLPKLNDPGAFRAWLYRVTRDRAFRTLRRRRAYHPFVDMELLDHAPEDDPFRVEDSARIHAALDRLAPEHREVLVLRFLEGMPY